MAFKGNILRNEEELTQFFGTWPTFHDVEVLAVSLERDELPSLGLKVFTFQRGNKVDKQGYFERFNRCIVTLVFHDVRKVEIQNFNRQNVIDSLQIKEKQPEEIEVIIEGTFGLSGSFVCSGGAVVKVERL